MRFKCLPLLILTVLSACSFQVDIIETPTPVSTVTPGESVPSASLPTAETASTPLSGPTLSATNTALPASAITPQGSIFPIQFAPDGTYVDIIESIKAGESKTYSISAMQGQVMSISFHQNDDSEWAYITMRIVGADDSVLCASDCEFWRGQLPVTQDYFVMVTPAADASDFVMRIAINPPGAATQSFVYENRYRNAMFSYTDLFAPALLQGAPMYRIDPELTLRFIDTPSFANTNLIESYLLFGSSTDPQIVGVCTEPLALDVAETVTGNVMINGVSFTETENSGVGAGNVYEQRHYRALEDGTCFEFTFFTHYGNIGNYDPAIVNEFDRGALIQRYEEVFSTFTLR